MVVLLVLICMVIDYVIDKGCKGKGCVVFLVVGNGNEFVEKDGYVSYELVIVVVVCNDWSICFVYSNYGKLFWCFFFSDDFEDFIFGYLVFLIMGIWIIDLCCEYGDNSGVSIVVGDIFGNYINNFGGIFSVCFGVVGVVVLIILVNFILNY